MNKVKLYVDDILVYQQEGTVTPLIVPPVVPPVNPPTPQGLAWVWDAYPMFWLNPGEEKVYIVNINQNYTYLNFGISGLTNNTSGTFTWTFPDGRVLPQPNLRQGVRDILGMNKAGLLVLKSQNYRGDTPNIPDQYIPQGNHVLRISASASSSYFKVGIEVY